MTQENFNITELGYNSIKQNLIDFLKTKPEFSDYDFAGSNLNVLVSLLSYNTEYMAFFMNMVANESFIDSAVLRSNLVSHAKTFGYVPRSRTSARAILDVTFNVSGSPDTIFIPRYTTFTARIDNRTYTFLTQESYTVFPESGIFRIRSLEVVEGKLFTDTYTINNNNSLSKFEIRDANIDISTLNVSIQNNTNDIELFPYDKADNLIGITDESSVFFVQENTRGKYEVYFGDGVFGKRLISGNIVYINYQISSGSEANSAGTFSLVSSIPFVTSVSNLVIVAPSAGGKERETDDEIRRNAIRHYEAQGRVVTKNDYEYYLKNTFSYIESANVWRGDENIPPVYGKVFISIKPADNLFLTNVNKQNIVQTIKERNVITVIPEIVDPTYTNIIIETDFAFDSSKTVKTASELSTDIRNNIFTFENLNLKKFNSNFIYSTFTTFISTIDRSITNNNSRIYMEKTFSPRFTVENNYEISFENKVVRGSLYSDKITINDKVYVFTDDYRGNVLLELASAITKTISANNKFGTIDYSTGRIQINNFLPSRNNGSTYDINIGCESELKDVKTERNNILILNRNKVKVSNV